MRERDRREVALQPAVNAEDHVAAAALRVRIKCVIE